MPALPLIQRPDSVASEKKTYRLSLNDCQSKHRRCNAFPGNDEAQLTDNNANNKTSKEPPSNFLDQWYFANRHSRHHDITGKSSVCPPPTPTPNRVRKAKSYNKRGLPRWVSQLGLWLPPTQRFERLLERFKKITDAWANFQRSSDARDNEHSARLQAFKTLKGKRSFHQYVDPLHGIRQKRVEREQVEREMRRLQDEARQKELAKRRRRIPKIIITDHDKQIQLLNQASTSSSLKAESESSVEEVINEVTIDVAIDDDEVIESVNDSNNESGLLETLSNKDEPMEVEKVSSPVPCVVVENVVDIINSEEKEIEKDEEDKGVAKSFLAPPPSLMSLVQGDMLIEDGLMITDETAGFMSGITPVPLGLSTGLIPDTAIQSSSSLDRYHFGAQARLNNTKHTKNGGAWCPKGNSAKEYLEVDLGGVTTVMQVATQGYPGNKDVTKKDLRWVTSYTLAFSNDGKKWDKYQHGGTVEVFEGNRDNNTVALHSLPSPVDTRYVRFYPKTWRNGIAMRVEVYGAFDDDVPEPCEPADSPVSLPEEIPEEETQEAVTSPDPVPSHHASPKIDPSPRPTTVTSSLSPTLEVDEESEDWERYKCSPDRMTPYEVWEEETIQSIVDAPSEEEVEGKYTGSPKTTKSKRKPKKPKPAKKEKKKKPPKKKSVKLPTITSAMTDLPEEDDDVEEEPEEEAAEEMFRIATPPLPEITKRPVDIRKTSEGQRFSMFPSKPISPNDEDEESKLSRARADNSIRSELLRQQLAEDRRKKLMKLEGSKRSPVQSSPSVDSRDFDVDVDYSIFKYCILSDSQVGFYRRIFESIDEDGDGFLFPEEILDALECVNKNLLENSHLKYIYRVLELCDCSLENGADFKFFSVVAAFSQKIATLDDYAKILISKLDFRELDYKLQRAKSLFKCYADEYTGKMSMEHLTLELIVGDLDSNTKDHVLRNLGPTTYLDFLDFLTYIPLFVHIHEHVLTHPLHDPRGSTLSHRRQK
ncbi:hypothetical protein QZH41_010344, partial [Actinostola sp. cb2023]